MSEPVKFSSDMTPIRVTKRGYEVIRDPLLNKGTGFSGKERKALGLEGLLPFEIHDQDTQRERIYRRLSQLPNDLAKYESITALQDRNEHLFYTVLCAYLEELLPIIYTPTVGQATKRYSHVFRRARGVWITPKHRGRIREVLKNATHGRQVKLMVVTDNESILGIGDQGAGGMAISVGKLALYCAAAGIHPSTTLPVSLDVGTENASLLDDPLYLGWRHRRLRGEEYESLVEEFVDAVNEVFPNVMLQWEDFRKDNALAILDRYTHRIASFNDDIQGTGAVALAGIQSALRVSGQSLAAQRIVILGAGAAGLGIARQIKNGLAKAGLDADAQSAAVAVLDSRGLIVSDAPLRDEYKKEMAWSEEIAARYGLSDPSNRDLLSVVQNFRPTVLIGSSGQSGAFTQDVITTMASHTERPVILPFSNPNDLSEARPRDVYDWTDGRALVATGSPFADVTFNDRTYKVGQGNNAFIFPGVGLGALLCGATSITDEMISAAADALAQALTDDELDQGLLFPRVERLRAVSHQVACAVIREAVEQNVGAQPGDNIEAFVEAAMWKPLYREYVAE
ncbi:MAG: NAD-dependent malic enzyme [Pseudomonadota bacterium]